MIVTAMYLFGVIQGVLPLNWQLIPFMFFDWIVAKSLSPSVEL